MGETLMAKRRKAKRQKRKGRAQRNKIGKYYVRRNKKGQFSKWTRIGRSLAADRRKSRPGSTVKIITRNIGHRGDHKKRGGLF